MIMEVNYMQVKENPSGDFTKMCRQFTRGSWTFSDQDHGWTVSDCTAEALKVHVVHGIVSLNTLHHNRLYKNTNMSKCLNTLFYRI